MSVLETFENHVGSVHRLMNFDRDVLSFAIESIEELQERLTQHHRLDNPQLTAARTLQMLRGYREHDSLRPRYKTIFNQALVLLVSYFGSAVHDVFRVGVSAALTSERDSPLLREQLKISFAELKEANFDLRTRAPDLLVNAKDISFQDMKSIARAFKENLGVEIERTPMVNEIILAQACRHVIVHTGALADDALVRQLSGAHPRMLKPKIVSGELVEFTPEEVTSAAAAMVAYLRDLELKLRA
ncbi:hypothetical protein [Polaromonas sp.]|uniref:hypothetical protein n=1 Tax=Polaromonas sp. TaxID=1869339 RepID=UPI003C815923